MLYPLLRPIIHALDAERAHRLTIAALKHTPPLGGPEADPALAIELAGLRFPNPVGLAAGFDKDAEVPAQMLGFGFGFVEVGTLTPLPQGGNPRPRLFRLAEDRAVINRMGFNNGGQADARARLETVRRRAGPVGVNIGANKDSADRIADYAAGARAMAAVADYLTVNISSPNTPGLRALQSAAALQELLHGVASALPAPKPVFLKVAPDLEPDEIDAIARVAIDGGVAALIVANTTVSRPPLKSPHAAEAGGLSGAPLAALARERLRDFRSATGGALPLISAGGIDGADEAYGRIRAGASLVQLYSALVYQGPALARRIARGLTKRLRRDGFASVAEAMGQA
ncbi:quinone-dependent dihydroorotate dehydrogenase [Sphingomonas sp. MAH-20]|uniref:Dihydroorotate dehydrogenase (quinone) n=1 Tax=Sphingomonas horti TaxID=2682842 RepID=A0A6I4IYE2_9SPHN|nr:MULTISPECIES: quinone-dependent dihydroorotate dehydrogenase [Sphingomonas]MBA2920952.1 quinone-dependent dihydroorotate dehydrogenase [Sphingomonas sp. CGMCC 1.13658]MVO76938.1 quinone-dependent dihydroorotate dehydrogenase [Sphingomonas horti]